MSAHPKPPPRGDVRAIHKSLRSPRDLKLRQLLRAARQAAGLSQQKLADRLGRPQSFVAKIEKSERRIDVAEFLAYAEALELDPCTLLTEMQKERA